MHTVTGRQCDKLSLMLQQARAEAQTDATIRFSSYLDSLIRHIAGAELSRIEIVELLNQESIRFHNIGLSREESI